MPAARHVSTRETWCCGVRAGLRRRQSRRESSAIESADASGRQRRVSPGAGGCRYGEISRRVPHDVESAGPASASVARKGARTEIGRERSLSDTISPHLAGNLQACWQKQCHTAAGAGNTRLAPAAVPPCATRGAARFARRPSRHAGAPRDTPGRQVLARRPLPGRSPAVPAPAPEPRQRRHEVTSPNPIAPLSTTHPTPPMARRGAGAVRPRSPHREEWFPLAVR